MIAVLTTLWDEKGIEYIKPVFKSFIEDLGSIESIWKMILFIIIMFS